MLELFPSLEEDIENFIVFADKLDGLYALHLLVFVIIFNIAYAQYLKVHHHKNG